MEVGDAAALVLAAASTFAVALLLWAVVALTSAVRELRAAAADLRDHAVPAVAAAHRTLVAAQRDVERIDDLLGAAEAVGSTVESASKLAYDAFSTPVIKALAIANGTGRAAKRLRTGTRRTGTS